AALEDLARGAVDRHLVPVAQDDVAAADAERARLVVDQQRLAADDADLAHLPPDEGRVARHAAPGGEDAPRRRHATEVLGRRLDAHQDHALAARRVRL